MSTNNQLVPPVGRPQDEPRRDAGKAGGNGKANGNGKAAGKAKAKKDAGQIGKERPTKEGKGQKGKEAELALEAIRADEELRPRAGYWCLGDITSGYTEDLRGRAVFPPVVVFFDGEVRWLADGFLRYAAYKAAGLGQIRAVVYRGTRDDARWYACGANKEFDRVGLRRTNADKRRAAENA